VNAIGKQTFEFTRSFVAIPLRRAWLLCLLVLSGACASSPNVVSYGSVIIPFDGEERESLADELPPALLELFDRVQELVLSHDDQAARNVLTRIYAYQLEGQALELADAFDRVLHGRALVSSLRIELVIQAHADDSARYRVALFMLNESDIECTLRPGPAVLTLEQTIVDGNGHERRNETSSSTDTLPEFILVPGESLQLSLQEFAPPVGLAAKLKVGPGATNEGLQTVLAARYSWHLSLLSSTFVVGDDEYPAMNFGIAQTERIWISSELPKASVSPAELVEKVHTGTLSAAELMGLAVRVPAQDCNEALRLLALEVEQLDQESLRSLAPSLRWISGDSRLGDDPSAWRAWIARQLRSESLGGKQHSGLDLPDSVSQP